MMSRETSITAVGRDSTHEPAITDRGSRPVVAHAPSPQLGVEPLELEAPDASRPAAAARAPAGTRCSPDPFIATDRYRLTMPYDDRI